jgi:hypothetical protein
VAVSVLTVPELWAEWISLLMANVGSDPRIQVIPLPFLVRLPIAVLLIVVAARTDRSWLLPIGVMLALPNVWTSSLALLAGSAALWWAERRSASADPATTLQGDASQVA